VASKYKHYYQPLINELEKIFTWCRDLLGFWTTANLSGFLDPETSVVVLVLGVVVIKFSMY